MSKQHVQVPNNMTLEGELTPKDLLVYTILKSYVSKNTQECYPSINLLAKKSGLSRPTVIKSISLLEKYKYITVRKEGRKNIYKFSPYKNFEPIDPELLNNEDILPAEKAYLIASMQSMFKDQEGYGVISYSDVELASRINLDRKTIAKYNKSLIEKGFLDIVQRKDENGLVVNSKFFHLNELGQKIIWVLQKHEEDINNIKEENSKAFTFILKELNEMKNEIKQLQIDKKILQEKANMTDQDLKKYSSDSIQL